MSFALLADQLSETARLLREPPPGLDARTFVAEADRFAKAFQKFRAVLQGVVAGQSPEVQALGRQLATAFAGDDKGLRAFAKKHAPPKGASFTAKDSVAARTEKTAAKIAAAGNEEAALADLRQRAAPSALDFSSQAELALLLQVRKLGQMSEDERQQECAKLLREPEKIRLLGQAAKIKLTARTTPKALLKKVLEIGARYAENTAR